MLHLWYSNRMEALVDTLLRVQSDDQQDPLTSLFTPLSLIIPNRQMDTFVRLSMARLTGITANVQSFFLGNFLTELLADTPGRLLTADVLHRLLLDVFHDQDILRHPALAPVRSYLAAAGSHAATADHRRFQFAGEVARLLEEYSFTRPAMLQEWEAQATADSGSTTMAWQRLLWRQLRAANGICERCTQRTGLAWLLLPEVGDWLLEQQVAIPAQLHIFGFSYVAESYHRLLARLAACSAVHLYMLHPCLEDDWSMAYRDPQEALRLWGRPGRENVRLLRQRTACTVTPQTLDPLAAGETVLRRVQHDILYRQAPAAGKAASRIPTDGSIRFLECPSLRREIDSIAETIWAMLQHDPGQGPERLRFSDIAVLVPAAQQDLYQAHIAAVFQEYHGIPYSMIDLPPVATSRVVDAVTRLLALPLGTFTRR